MLDFKGVLADNFKAATTDATRAPGFTEQEIADMSPEKERKAKFASDMAKLPREERQRILRAALAIKARNKKAQEAPDPQTRH